MGAPGRHAERNRWPAISSCRPLNSSFSRSKACPVPRYGARIHALSHRVRTSIAIPPTTSARQPPGPTSSLVRKQCCAASTVPRNPTNLPYRHSGESRNPEGWGEGIVAPGLVPSLGRTARSRKLHGPAYHHFHPLMRPSQGHGDSRAGGNPRTLASHTHGTRETGIHVHKEPQAPAPRIHSHRRIS